MATPSPATSPWNTSLRAALPFWASYLANNGVSLAYQDYVNAFSGALPQYTPYSNITPGLGELQVFYNGAYSSYSALQVEARKISAAHGLQFQANYTWGKVMTDADDLWNVGGPSGGAPPKTTLSA